MTKTAEITEGAVAILTKGDPGLERFLRMKWAEWGGQVTLEVMWAAMHERFEHFPGTIISKGDPRWGRLVQNHKQVGVVYPLENSVVRSSPL